MRLFAFVIISIVLPLQLSAEDTYQVGGSKPIPDVLQKQLDNYRDYIQLGINTDWLTKAGLNPARVVESYLEVAKAVKEEEITGTVVLVDKFIGENIPIGIGYRIVDPEKHRTEWDTFYEIGELTGAVAVVPLALRALEDNRIHLGDSIAYYLEFLEDTPKENITIEMLLRHTSALPADFPIPPEVRTKEDMQRILRAMPLMNEPGKVVSRNGLNFLLLGLVLESVYDMPVQELAQQQIFQPLGMVNTVSDFPDHLRDICAPGPFSRWHKRLVWGEAAEPSAFIYGSSAGNGGLITGADDMALLMRAMMFAYTAGAGDFVSTPTLQSSLRPDMDVAGGHDQGLGWALNGFGEGSFGWDSPNGCSFWINPHNNMLLLILANAEHPVDRREAFDKVRKTLIETLQDAILGEKEEACIRVKRKQKPSRDYTMTYRLIPEQVEHDSL